MSQTNHVTLEVCELNQEGAIQLRIVAADVSAEIVLESCVLGAVPQPTPFCHGIQLCGASMLRTVLF